MRSLRIVHVSRLKISKASDRFPGHVDPDVFGGSVGVADKGSDATGVEDAIKITTCGLGGISELIARCIDRNAGIVGLFQTFCGFESLLQHRK